MPVEKTLSEKRGLGTTTITISKNLSGGYFLTVDRTHGSAYGESHIRVDVSEDLMVSLADLIMRQ